MQMRETHIPILLWVCAAAMLHLGGSEQSERLASSYAGKVQLRSAARELVAVGASTLEIDFTTTEPNSVIATEDTSKNLSTTTEPLQKTEPPKPQPETPTSHEKVKSEVVKNKEDKKKDPVAPPKPLEVKKEQEPETPKMASIPEPPAEKRTAIQQHQDNDQAPNPNAKYWAEKNRHVRPEDETHAKITSLHENHKEPTPGSHAGAASEPPGNSDKTVVAHDANRSGAKIAPEVTNQPPKSLVEPSKPTLPELKPGKVNGDQRPNAHGNDPKVAMIERPMQAAAPGQPVTPSQAPNPEIVAGSEGTFSVPPASSGTTSSSSKKAPGNQGLDEKIRNLLTLPIPGVPQWATPFGIGLQGDGGKFSLIPSEKVIQKVIGEAELKRLRTIDGETRLSRHRGAWRSSSLERWRGAIENYIPGVKVGNQTNLGAAAAPWATYLVHIHTRLHPIFAEGFVDSLGSYPSNHPLSDSSLVTRMEIVLREDGTIHRLGIIKSSGVLPFDVAALDAVDRAAPFEKPPTQILSPDGFAYLHWEFHRDEQRCHQQNAYPYLLKQNSKTQPPQPVPEKSPPIIPESQDKRFGLYKHKLQRPTKAVVPIGERIKHG